MSPTTRTSLKSSQAQLDLRDAMVKAPQPFLRWAGGKRRLTSLLIQAFPSNFDPTVNRYFEPFIGGGALMFATGNKYGDLYIPGKNIHINDSNPDLVITYRAIKNQLPELLMELRKITRNLTK